jgi:hypothetical protein
LLWVGHAVDPVVTGIFTGIRRDACRSDRARLGNANIASIDLVERDGKLVEVVTFTYQKIEWTWSDGGIVAMDDWQVSK